MEIPKKPAARALFWYVRFKGVNINGMTVQAISQESGTPRSTIYEHAAEAGIKIERQGSTVELLAEK